MTVTLEKARVPAGHGDVAPLRQSGGGGGMGIGVTMVVVALLLLAWVLTDA